MNSTSGTDGITEDDIAGYLANTPGFFERHAELLATVQLSSPHGARAVSLQERQMEMLRERIKNLERKIMEMIRYGQDNMAIADRLHRWTRAVMLTHDPRQLAPVLVHDLQHQFQIPQAAVRVWGVAPELAHLPCAAEVSDDVKIFATSLVAPYCGANSGFEAAGWFENAESVMSLALIPLRPDRQHTAFGLLALGSPDPDALHGGHGHRVPGAGRRHRRRRADPVAGLRHPQRSPVTAAIERYLEHLRVERRVSAHTLTAYGDALARLEKLADAAQRPLHALQSAHIQRFAAQLHGAGLGARSIALTLSGWRGFYRWWSLQADAAGLANNPVDGIRAPRAARPLPKALAVDEAVALADGRDARRRRRRGGVRRGRGARRARPRDRRAAVRLRAAARRAAGARPRRRRRVGRLDRLDDATAHVFGKGSKRRSVPVGGPALRGAERLAAASARCSPGRPTAARCSSAASATGCRPTSCARA